MATGPKIFRKRPWSKRGDARRVLIVVASSPLGSTAFYGTGFLKGRRHQNAARLSAPDALGQVPCTSHTPSSSAEASEDASRIRQAVASLPEAHRLVVELRFFAGATLDEMAAALGCPLGTVKSRLHHAFEKLRQMNLEVNLFTSTGESRDSKP